MITNFKIFENDNNPMTWDEDDLVNLLSQKYIEKYFESNWEVDIEEASIAMNLWNYVDIDTVRDDLIKQIADDTNIFDKKFNKNDYIKFIEDNIDDFRKGIKKYRKSNYLGKIDDNETLQEMTKDDLVELIENEDKRSEFLVSYFEDEFGETNPEELLYIIHGKWAVKDGTYLPFLRNYIDESVIIEDYINAVPFESKYDYVRDSIGNDIDLQTKLFNMNHETVFALYDVMDTSQMTFGETYEYQKAYIELSYSMEDNVSPDDIYPSVLKQLNDNFGLDTRIKKEYEEYTYLIDVEKFNL